MFSQTQKFRGASKTHERVSTLKHLIHLLLFTGDILSVILKFLIDEEIKHILIPNIKN